MQATGVLNDRIYPENGRARKGVESRVVETLADVPSCCEDQPFFVRRDAVESCGRLATLRGTHTAFEDHEVAGSGFPALSASDPLF